MAKLVYRGLKANLPSVRENAFYLTTDTRELYFGNELYSEAVRFYTGDKPAAPAQGVLYISEDNGSGDVFNGTAWKNIIKPYITKIEAGVTDAQVATAKAVKDYVDGVVTGGIGALGALASKDEVADGDLEATLKAKIDDAAAKATALTGEDANKSARAIAAEEVAKVVAGADESFDTLKEIADWISGHQTDAAAMNSAIKALQAIVDGIGGEGESATVVAYVDAAIKALNIGDYAKAADLTAAVARITELETKVGVLNGTADVEGSVAKALADAKAYADTKASGALSDAKTYADGKAAAAETNAKAYADGLAVNYDAAGSADTAETNAKAHADTKAGEAETNAKKYADGLNDTMNGRVSDIEDALEVGTF